MSDNKELIKRLRDEPDAYERRHGLSVTEMIVWHRTACEGGDALEAAEQRIAELEEREKMSYEHVLRADNDRLRRLLKSRDKQITQLYEWRKEALAQENDK